MVFDLFLADVWHDEGEYSWSYVTRLTQITEIRLQLARTEVFRGYRAMPVAFSGGVAVLAAVIQAVTIPDPIDAGRPLPRVMDRRGGGERAWRRDWR